MRRAMAAVAERAVARARGAAGPPAMHAADPLAAHRRLAAGPMIVLAARLATGGQGEVGLRVAVPQPPTGHGIGHRVFPRGGPGGGHGPGQGGPVDARQAARQADHRRHHRRARGLAAGCAGAERVQRRRHLPLRRQGDAKLAPDGGAQGGATATGGGGWVGGGGGHRVLPETGWEDHPGCARAAVCRPQRGGFSLPGVKNIIRRVGHRAVWPCASDGERL